MRLAWGLMMIGMDAKVAGWQGTLRWALEEGVFVEAWGRLLVWVQGGYVWKSDIMIINFRLAIVTLARCYFMSRTSRHNLHPIRCSSWPTHVHRWSISGVQEHVLLRRLLNTGSINTGSHHDDFIYTSWLRYVVSLAAGVALVIQIKQLLRLGYN